MAVVGIDCGPSRIEAIRWGEGGTLEVVSGERNHVECRNKPVKNPYQTENTAYRKRRTRLCSVPWQACSMLDGSWWRPNSNSSAKGGLVEQGVAEHGVVAYSGIVSDYASSISAEKGGRHTFVTDLLLSHQGVHRTR